MDDFDKPRPTKDDDADKPIPLDDIDEILRADDEDKPVPLDATPDKPVVRKVAQSNAGISHSPLHLDSSASASAPKPAVPAAQPTPVKKKTVVRTAAPDRITAAKTFFAKLQAGSINFLDQQICDWLEQNPDIVIKRTNTVTGMLQGKRTEPNLLITVWY